MYNILLYAPYNLYIYPMYLVEFSKCRCITCLKIHVVILLSNRCSRVKEAQEVTPLLTH